MLRVISLNVNGIRAAARKGFFEWMKRQRADVVCLQEIKAWTDQLSPKPFWPAKHATHYLCAEKKGYSGVAIMSRNEPDRITEGLGWPEFDREARWLQFDFGKLSVVSLYLPSGSSSELRQGFKFEVLEYLDEVLLSMRRKRREYILCGDWNIAHKKIDLKNWRGNQKNSGFLPEEREWMDGLFGRLGYVDAFRVVNQKEDQYTWWSNRGAAWDKNVGWRIDYQVITPGLEKSVSRTAIYRNRRFSDHAPLTIDYDL